MRDFDRRDRRILTLLGAELRAMGRDYGTIVSLLTLTVLVGLLSHASALLPEDVDRNGEDDGPEPAWACRADELPMVAFVTAGEGAAALPAWLDWPGPLAADAGDETVEVLVEVGPPATPDAPREIRAVALVEEARLRPVVRCLQARRDAERARRLEALGVVGLPDSYARTEAVVAPPDGSGGGRRGPPGTLGLSMAGGLALLMLSTFLDTGPRARASGWMESWLVLPGRRSDLVLAWWLLGMLVGAVGVGFVLFGHALGEASLGADTGTLSAAAVPPLIAVLSAVGVRAFLDVEDVRTALVRSIPVLLGTTITFGLAMLAEDHLGLGAAVPLGGLALVLAGWSDAVMLAALSSLAFTALLLWDSGRVLDRLAVNLGALGATAARRARGDYLPEALLLFVLAAAGVGAWAPPELLLPDVALRTIISMAAFFLLPAVLINVPLGLRRGPLLSWRPPPARAWLLLLPLLPATLTLAGQLWDLSVRWGPDNGLLEDYASLVGDFASPLGLIAISVVPGICEELLFRGAMLGLLRKRLPTWAAVVVQALAFAALHGLAIRLPYTFVLGLVFGLLVVRSRSLWPAIVAHLLHNLVSTQLPPEAFEAWLSHPATWAVGVAAFPLAWAAGTGRPDPR